MKREKNNNKQQQRQRHRILCESMCVCVCVCQGERGMSEWTIEMQWLQARSLYWQRDMRLYAMIMMNNRFVCVVIRLRFACFYWFCCCLLALSLVRSLTHTHARRFSFFVMLVYLLFSLRIYIHTLTRTLAHRISVKSSSGFGFEHTVTRTLNIYFFCPYKSTNVLQCCCRC